MTAMRPEMNAADLEAVLRSISERTGLAIPPERLATSHRQVGRAMMRAGVSDLAQLTELIATDSTAFDALVDELTVGETYFFRDPRQLDFLRTEAIPDILRHRAGRDARVWSAGCATGEEPYSLAILLRELGAGTGSRTLGTDLSRARLTTARRGRYGKWSLRGVADDVIARYFRRHEAQYEFVPAIRSSVTFEPLNLAGSLDPQIRAHSVDLILCRNVLIYFDAATIERVARQLLDRLADGGWLLLGPSDPMLTDLVDCEVVVTGAGLVYRRREARKRRSSDAATRPGALAGTEGRIVASTTRSRTISPTPSPHATPTPAAVTRPPARSGGVADTLNDARRSYAAHQYEGAIHSARQYLEGGGREMEGTVLLVRALANTGASGQALRAAAAGLELHPGSAELLCLRSLLLTEAGQYDGAAEAARSALYLDRTMIVAHLALGTALAHAGRLADAQRACTNALNLLASMGDFEVVPASDGEPVNGLREIARRQLRLLRERSA